MTLLTTLASSVTDALMVIENALRQGRVAEALIVVCALRDSCAPPFAVYLLTAHEAELIEATRKVTAAVYVGNVVT